MRREYGLIHLLAAAGKVSTSTNYTELREPPNIMIGAMIAKNQPNFSVIGDDGSLDRHYRATACIIP